MRTLVATARSSVQGALIVGVLQSHGLDASMSGDYVGDARPALNDREILVWVPEDQAQRARAVVRDVEGAFDTD